MAAVYSHSAEHWWRKVGGGGVLTIYMEKTRKFRVENHMVRAIPFGKVQKTWVWFQAIQFFYSSWSVQLIWIKLFGGLFSYHVKVYSFISMHKISTRVVCANGPGWAHHRPWVYYALFADNDNFELPCDVNFECITSLLHCFHLFTCNYLALLIVTLNGAESRLSSSFR